jgi:hypothetical protein
MFCALRTMRLGDRPVETESAVWSRSADFFVLRFVLLL